MCCCCMALAEMRFVKLQDPRAIVQVALHGTDWEESSSKSFGLMYRSRHLVEFAENMNSRMLFVSKLFVMAVSGTITFAVLHHTENIYNPTGPTVVVCLVAWAIGTCYTDVYAVTVDAIMMCFAEDRERHDGSFMRQYYMTAGLKQLLLEDLRTSKHEDHEEELVEEIVSSESENEDGDHTTLVDMDVEAKRERE